MALDQRLLRPMLATSGRAPTHGEWAWELKWDGIRAMAALDGRTLLVVSRNGNEVSHRYPELATLGDRLPDGTVLDGELVATDELGRPSFQQLQRRMHLDDPAQIARAAVEVPVTYLCFDLVALGDDVLTNDAYERRRFRLGELELPSSRAQVPPHEIGDGSATIALSRARGLEGVVAKRLGSKYHLGRRTRDWIKVKHLARQELVVGGWLPGEGGRAGTLGALLVGHYESTDDGSQQLRYAGRIGTGFTEADLRALRTALDRIASDTSPFAVGPVPRGARFVEPVIVAEVRFREWTDSGILRQPVFVGIRADVDPSTVVREPVDHRTGA